jgi:repressor LexA
MDELTPRQRQVLRFIQEAVFQQGMPPTRAEIAEALGFKSAMRPRNTCAPCNARGCSI